MQNPEACYETTQLDSAELEKLLSGFTPIKKPSEAQTPPSEVEKKKKEEEAAKLAAYKKQKEDELAKKRADEEAAMKQQQDEAAAKAKAEAEAKLKQEAGKFIDTPLAKAKLSEIDEFKGGKDVGLKAAATKLKLAFRPMRAGDINFDVIHWDSKDGELILCICWYVCVNGPVGVGKRTRFGNMPGNYCIKEVFEEAGYPDPVSNAMWRKFCRKLVDHIDVSKPEVKQGRMMQLYGKLWPLCDAELVTQVEFKARRKQKYLDEHGLAFVGI